MTPIQQHYATAANTVIAALAKRNMSGSYAENGEEAVKQALEFLKPGMCVSNGGSVTINELGMMDAAAKKGCTVLARNMDMTESESREFFAKVNACDCYFMSTNAITKDGMLYNIDGMGNRVSALIHGPQRVIVIAGMNKLVATLEDAEHRVRNIASPPNCHRLGYKTPCAVTGFCSDCQSPDCICCQSVITRRSRIANRIHVILVGEVLGY